MESLPFLAMVREVVARPFSLAGLVSSIVCALPLLLDLSELDLHAPALLLSSTMLAFVYVLVVRHGGRGQAGFPIPRVWSRMDRAVLGRSFGAGACLLFLAALPMVVMRSVVEEVDLFAVFLVPCLFLPAAIVAVAVEGSAAAAFWPFGWVRIASSARLEYVKLAFGFLLLTLVLTLTHVAIEAVAPYSGLLAFTIASIGNLVWFAQATFVGTFVRRYVEDVPVMSARKPVLVNAAGE